MKLLLVFLALSISVSAWAADVAFTGDSAKFMYLQLKQRSGTKTWESKSFLGNPVENTGLESLLECNVKHGRFLGDSFSCRLPGTSSMDIQGGVVIDFSKDELTNAVSDLNNALFLRNPLRVNGASASRLFFQLKSFSSDPSFFTRSGVTSIMRNNFEGMGIAEMYCQVTHRTLLGDAYSCLIANVALRDSNVHVTVIPNNSTAK